MSGKAGWPYACGPLTAASSSYPSVPVGCKRTCILSVSRSSCVKNSPCLPSQKVQQVRNGPRVMSTTHTPNPPLGRDDFLSKNEPRPAHLGLDFDVPHRPLSPKPPTIEQRAEVKYCSSSKRSIKGASPRHSVPRGCSPQGPTASK